MCIEKPEFGDTPPLYNFVELYRAVEKRGLEDTESEKNLRCLVAMHLENLSAHDIPHYPEWSLATMLCKTYIKHLARTPDWPRAIAMCPDDWYLFGPGVSVKDMGTRDLTDLVCAIATRWRTTTVTGQHFLFVRNLERLVAQRVSHEWLGDDYSRILDILVFLWGAEYVGFVDTNILNCDESNIFSAPEAKEAQMMAWVHNEATTAKGTPSQKSHKHMFFEAEAWPGEPEAYSRHSAGVEASTYEDIVSKERTHVQFTCIERGVERYQLHVGAGILNIYLMNAHIKAEFGFDWITDCFFVERELMSPLIKDRLMCRGVYSIVLFGGRYYVLDKDRSATLCASPVSALYLWFKKTKAASLAADKDGPVVFDAIENVHVIQRMYADPDFPFAE